MKLVITESQLQRAYINYLNLLMGDIKLNFEKSNKDYKVFYDGPIRTFTYSVRSEDVYFLESTIRDFHSMFSDLEWEEVLNIIGKWIQYKFGYPVREVHSVERMSEN